MGGGKGHKTARELYNCSCVGSREQRTKVKKLVLPGSWNSFSLAQRKRRNLWGAPCIIDFGWAGGLEFETALWSYAHNSFNSLLVER